MGGKASKSSLSVEDLAFLVTNTNLSTEEIQVRHARTGLQSAGKYRTSC